MSSSDANNLDAGGAGPEHVQPDPIDFSPPAEPGYISPPPPAYPPAAPYPPQTVDPYGTPYPPQGVGLGGTPYPPQTGYPQQYGVYPQTGYPAQEYPSYPPLPDPYAPAPYAPAYAPPYVVGYNPTEKNNQGVAALVLGIVSCCCTGLFTGIIAIVLGVQGRRAADEGRATNKAMATAGMVLGIIGTVLVTIGWIIATLPWY